jgi:hypothetical protein
MREIVGDEDVVKLLRTNRRADCHLCIVGAGEIPIVLI